MCIGALAAGGGALGIIGTLFTAYGQYQQGKAAQRAAEYDAAVAANNAKIMEYQAQDAAFRAEDQKAELRKNVARMRADARTGYAAGNVALGSGSPVDYEIDLAQAAEADIMDIESNRDREVWGINIQRQNFLSQSERLRLGGKSAKTAGLIAAGGSLLSGVYDFGMRR